MLGAPLVMRGRGPLPGAHAGYWVPPLPRSILVWSDMRVMPERFGRNQRFASTGGLAAAELMGVIGYAFSYRTIFLLVVALTLLLFVALARIHKRKHCGV